MSEVVKRKRGRPPKNNETKYCVKGVRLSKTEEDHLRYIANKTGKNESDILREGLRMQYNLISFKR